MQSPEIPDSETEATPSAPGPKVITEPDFSGTAQPISQWTELPDFPQCALGAYVSIHGFEGVVVEIVKQSIKVLAPDGTLQRFNAYRLKTLFAPPDRTKPAPEPPPEARPEPVVPPRATRDKPKPAEPPRVYIAEPDFSTPVLSITVYANQPNFPKCAYGRHVNIPDYSGVVVEIVKGSLKVQSTTGSIRSYNCEALKKLYGKP